MNSFTATSVSGQKIGRMVECAEVLNKRLNVQLLTKAFFFIITLMEV